MYPFLSLSNRSKGLSCIELLALQLAGNQPKTKMQIMSLNMANGVMNLPF
jgi:hypothetical protein